MDFIRESYGYYLRLDAEWKIAAVLLGLVLTSAVYLRWRIGRKPARGAKSSVVKQSVGKSSVVRQIVAAALLVYIFLVYASTVLSRQTWPDFHYELVPFWSYRKILEGQTVFITENFFNVLMLLPIGLMLPIIRPAIRGRTVILTGFLCSVSIEVLQLVTKRGLFEFDDIIHNTLGTAIGYRLYIMIHCSKACSKACNKAAAWICNTAAGYRDRLSKGKK